MITPFQMYLLLMLDSICVVATIITIVLAFITFMIGRMSVANDVNEEDQKFARKLLNYLVPVFILSLFVEVFIH